MDGGENVSDDELDELLSLGEGYEGLDDLLDVQADSSIKNRVEEALLVKVLREKDTKGFNWLVRQGCTADMLSAGNREIWELVSEFRRDYGVVPDMELLEVQRPSMYERLATVPVFASPIEALYDELLQDKVLQEITQLGAGIAEKMKAEESGFTILDFVQEHIQLVARKYTRSQFQTSTVGSLGDALIQDYMDGVNNVSRGIPIPYLFLQEALGGWELSQMSAIVGKPGTGKTWFELLCVDAAVHGDPYRWTQAADLPPYTEEQKEAARAKALLVSMEMSDLDISRRLVSIYQKMSFAKIRAHKLSDEEREKYFNFIKGLKPGGINEFIENRVRLVGPGAASTVEQIAAQAEDFGADFVIIDGFYLLEGQGDEPWQRVGHNTRAARLQCLKTPTHWQLASQLNRSARSRDSTSLDTLAFSSSIGFDCTNVFALAQTADQKKNRFIDLFALKVRDGDVGVPYLYNWNPVTMNFSEIGQVDVQPSTTATGSSGGSKQLNY